MIAFFMEMLAAYFFVIIAWYLLCAFGKWKMFEKMGEPGILGLIPLYSDYILFKKCWNTTMFFAMLACSIGVLILTGSDGAYTIESLGELFSLAAAVIGILFSIKLARSFGKGYLFAFGLFFLAPLFTIILGLGDSRYLGNTTE